MSTPTTTLPRSAPIDVTTIADVVTVSLDDIVDLATAPELREALLPMTTESNTLVLDLSGVSFLDSQRTRGCW